MDLDAIAAEEEAKRKSGPPCWLCSIPEREWVDKARKEGRSVPVILAVLLRKGYPPDVATFHRVKGHLGAHVR